MKIEQIIIALVLIFSMINFVSGLESTSLSTQLSNLGYELNYLNRSEGQWYTSGYWNFVEIYVRKPGAIPSTGNVDYSQMNADKDKIETLLKTYYPDSEVWIINIYSNCGERYVTYQHSLPKYNVGGASFSDNFNCLNYIDNQSGSLANSSLPNNNQSNNSSSDSGTSSTTNNTSSAGEDSWSITNVTVHKNPNYCNTEGIRNIVNSSYVYCLNGVWNTQKEVNSSCQNNFECLSNLCISSRCINFVQPDLNSVKDNLNQTQNQITDLSAQLNNTQQEVIHLNTRVDKQENIIQKIVNFLKGILGFK